MSLFKYCFCRVKFNSSVLNAFYNNCHPKNGTNLFDYNISAFNVNMICDKKWIGNAENRRHFTDLAGSKEDQNIRIKEGTVYYDYIKTSVTQQLLLTIGSALVSITQPTRTDMVATLAETATPISVYNKMFRKMASDPTGQRILRDRPIINSRTLNLDSLQKLPDFTLGKNYAMFMAGLGLSADTRSPVHFVENEDLAYVIYRYRTVHDFLHVLLGMPSVSVAAEVAVKWFEMAQTGIPMTVLGASFGLFANGVSPSERKLLIEKLIPWALLCGTNCKFVLNLYFEELLEKNLEELRREIGILPAPIVL